MDSENQSLGHPQRKPLLRLVTPQVAPYVGVLQELLAGGARNFLVQGLGEFAAAFVAEARQAGAAAGAAFFGCPDEVARAGAAGLHPLPEGLEPDAAFLCHSSTADVAAALQKYSAVPGAWLCAPRNENFFAERPLMIQSIPKAGTHLLFECARAFGYGEPPHQNLPTYDEELQDGIFYNLQHMRMEYLAQPHRLIWRFSDAMGTAPILFIYRDPRDIAVSMAHYLAKQKDYHVLSAYMESLPPHERLSAVICGRYPMPVYINDHYRLQGDIRSMMMTYTEWLKKPLPRVVPISFEEIVGPRGGGDREAQLRAVWRLQLALHVPGSPADYADRFFSEDSATFRRGRIGSYRDEFTDEHYRLWNSLPQDFMDIYGYKREDATPSNVPSPAAAAPPAAPRSGAYFLHTPHLVEQDYRGYNIVRYGLQYVGLAIAMGDVQISHLKPEAVADLRANGLYVSGQSHNAVRLAVDACVIRQLEHTAALCREAKDATSSQEEPRREIQFSFLVPTRNRPDDLRTFLRSIVDTTHNLQDVEVILGIDADDHVSREVTCAPLKIKIVTTEPGLTMGELNRRCFAASSGRFVMLLNDDVVLRTKDWDLRVQAAVAPYADDVVLVHTNDLLFRQRLCTFPMLSRRACEIIDICPGEYKRYRIDDHIYDVYNMLALLGHRRILFLPEVIFEHCNHQEQANTATTHHFHSEDRKVYQPKPGIIEVDAAMFDGLIGQRKQDAIALAAIIEQSAIKKRRKSFENTLAGVHDRESYRRPDFVQVVGAGGVPSASATVTVAVVTSSIYRPFAKECIERVKKYTKDFDLIILDNNGGKDFNHPREMNRILKIVRTDYLVLMDDDVYVEEGWLDALLRSMGDRVGVVGPLHKDARGQVSHAGVYLAGDGQGTHAHLLEVTQDPQAVQCLCSACLLIDVRKCRHIAFDESYQKYFLDLVHSLQVWEAGYEVLCTPYTKVTHLAGATMPQGSGAAAILWNRDRTIFIREWIETGRLARLERNVWAKVPAVAKITQLPQQILQTVPLKAGDWDTAQLQQQVGMLEKQTTGYPLLRGLLAGQLSQLMTACHEAGDAERLAVVQKLKDLLRDAPLISADSIPTLVGSYAGYNLVKYQRLVFAVPMVLGPMNLTESASQNNPLVLRAATLDEAKLKIDGAPAIVLSRWGRYRISLRRRLWSLKVRAGQSRNPLVMFAVRLAKKILRWNRR